MEDQRTVERTTALDRRAPSGRGRAPSIQGTWRRSVLLFIAILVLVVAATLGFTRVTRTQVDDAADRSQQHLETIAVLQQEISELDTILPALLYENAENVTMADALSSWNAAKADIGRRLASLTSDDGYRRQADAVEVRALWTSVEADVERAKEMWGTRAAVAQLTAGDDPWNLTWLHRATAQQLLASLGVDAVGEFETLREGTHARDALLERTLAAAIVVVIALGAVTARGVSRRVVQPVLALRDSMIAVRDGRDVEAIAVPPAAGRELLELAVAADEMLSELQVAQGRLYEHAYTDSLTGLPNRRAFSALLDEAATEGLDGRTAVVLLDVDDFKVVNDSLGHSAGDELLLAISRRLLGASRDSDLVTRFGGDEFAIVVREDDAIRAAASIADRLLTAFEDDVVVGGHALRVTISIGLADGHGAADAEALLAHADSAMYVAKGRGKACFEIFDPLLHATMLQRSETKVQLRHAARAGELVLHYQPVVDLSSGATIGFEALVRWLHPERGLLMPGDFIAAAEESGDIIGIGEWVLDRACQDVARWQRAAGRPLWMSVNASSRQVMSGTLVGTVREALTRHGLDGASLVVELTDATTVADLAPAVSTLQALRALGVRVAIDDFGTGFSSLQHLRQLPIDIVKIDRSFISSSGDAGDGDVMLSGIVSITRDLGFEVIAEGIEHGDELHRLRELGELAGQGYYLARPMEGTYALEHLGVAVRRPEGTVGDPALSATLGLGGGVPART